MSSVAYVRAVLADATPLVRRIRDGDVSAEDELVRSVQPYVLGGLFRRIRDREAVRELANDVLMAVVCALRAGRLRDSAKLLAFVGGTLRNVANGYFRARGLRAGEEPLPAELPARAASDGLEDGERDAAMRRGFARLPGPDREILLLTIVEGRPPRQVARDLGLTSEVVRARKSRALQRLITSVRADGLGADSSGAPAVTSAARREWRPRSGYGRAR
jgi:RNA polymerase sigma factor (sigma-70 family)